MAIAFTLNSSSSGGRQAGITLPATVSAGDLLVAMHYDITNETIPSAPSGWTLINSITSGGAAGTLGIVAKIADGTEGGASLSWLPGTDNNYAAFFTNARRNNNITWLCNWHGITIFRRLYVANSPAVIGNVPSVCYLRRWV